jgi:branched-chain amino acid transport system permease protein
MSASLNLYLVFVGAYILLVWAFYIPFRAGQLYNGPVYCMAIGGYFAAFAVTKLGVPFFIAVVGSAVLAGIFGFFPALGFSRTTGVVTAVASMALIFIIQAIIGNVDFVGGAKGFWGVPKIGYLLPFTWALVVIFGTLIHRLDNSRLGRAIEVIGTDPDLASSMGVNIRQLTVFALTASSVIGGVAGAIYAVNLRTLRPETFGFSVMLTAAAMLFLGGRYTLWGAFIAVPILWGLPQWLPSSVVAYTNFIYGAVLIIVLITRPEGIVTRRIERWVGDHVARSR